MKLFHEGLRAAALLLTLGLTACGADTLESIQSDLVGGETVGINVSLNDEGNLVIGVNNDSSDDSIDESTGINTFPLPEMVDIQAGCFDIGSPLDEPLRNTDESPQLNVCVEEFRLGQFEVTFEQYDAFAIDTGRSLPDDSGFGRGDLPVSSVDWNDAKAYTVWLSEQTGQNFRLPTEAEWEYSARAGTTSIFHTGQTITSDQANFQALQSFNGGPVGVFRNQPTPVGSFPANDFGLHDMHGNVQEWTCSTFIGDYRSPNAPQTCEPGTTGRRMLRGGAWRFTARDIRSADRNSLFTSFNGASIGFRVLQEQ